MKHLSCIINVLVFIFAFLSSDVNAQWEKIPVGTTQNLKDLFFINSETGWVVGSGSTILKTTDGGETWIAQQPNINQNISSVFFLDESFGWAGCGNGTILRTTDGGVNWSVCMSNTVYNISRLYFTDRQNGYATVHRGLNDRYGWILKSTDGGKTWNQSFAIDGYLLLDISFPDKYNGWVSASNGYMIKTTDAGANWETSRLRTACWLHSVYFVNDAVGWAAGGNYDYDLVYKTTNGGNTWFEVRRGDPGMYLSGCYFINENTGWACAENGTILRTDNGGESWSKEKINTPEKMEEIFVSGNTGYVIGTHGTIYKSKLEKKDSRLHLLAPDGDEEWEIGSTQLITWESKGVTDVKIEYSYNNGASWNEVAGSYPSTGVFEWTIPNILTNQARIKITDKNSFNVSDSSEDTFRIVR